MAAGGPPFSFHAMLRAIPNLLSASRLLLAPAFVVVDGAPARVGLIIAAGLTDFLDGFIARRANLTSRWGALVDPIADRFFALTAIATLLFNGALSVPQYFMLIARDLMTAVGFLVARAMPSLRPVEFKARWFGKVVTVLQFAALLGAIIVPVALPVLVGLAFVASLISIGDYTNALRVARRRNLEQRLES